MSDLSEDDSSDSSSEFLISPDKINQSDNYFGNKKSESVSAPRQNNIDEESTDDEDFRDVTPNDNIELFSQVLKNLESTQTIEASAENAKKEKSVMESVKTPRKKELQVQQTSPNEIKKLLLQGETSTNLYSNGAEDENADEDDEDNEDTTTPEGYSIPKDGVNITLPGTSCLMRPKKKKKNGVEDLKALLRRKLRANSILIEKVGLLCWLSYGFHLNRQINQPEVMATALSLISVNNYPKNRVDLKYLEKFTKFFKNIFTFQDVASSGNDVIDKEALLKILKERKISDYKPLVLLYISALRALGLNCRLVVSLCPPHRALDNDPLLQPESKSTSKKSSVTEKSTSKTKASKKGNSITKAKDTTDTPSTPANSPEAKKNAQMEAKKRAAEILRSTSQSKAKKAKRNEKSKEQNNVKKESDDEEKKRITNLRQLRSRKVASNNSDNGKVKKNTDIASKTDGTTSKYYEVDSDSEAEFEPRPIPVMKKKSNKEEKVTENNKKNNRKLLSSDSEDEESNTQKKTQDIWTEVYLESEESWICVSIMNEKVHCVSDIYKKAKKPVLYVVAWNADGLIKDVTRRYAPRWLTVTRKQRIDEKWWQESILPWKEKQTAISKAEDEMLLQK